MAQQEINELREKVKDLESKLDTLRIRRAQDKDKLREAERLRIQNEQLQENKKQMSEKIVELQKAKTQAEREVRETREELLRHIEETEGLHETAEMAILEKETAEEKYELCAKELEETHDKLEETKVELEILKIEIEGKGTGQVVTNYQVTQLEQQNDKLKDALLKLRDISAQDKSQINNLQKELEKAQSEIAELNKLKDRLSNEINDYEAQIIELKEQIDIGLGSQQMVEKLTEKNLALEDKIVELQEALDEEEDLRDSNNQILELKEEQMLELREELDMSQSKISVMKQELYAAEEKIKDYESTIQKFRDMSRSKSDYYDMEMNELKIALKNKIDEIAELKIRTDSLEEQLSLADKCADDRVVRLQDDFDKYKAECTDKQAEYVKTLGRQQSEINDLGIKIRTYEEEVDILKKGLKSKIDEASELKIRKDLIEKKLTTATRDTDERVSRLQAEFDRVKAEFRDKEVEFEKTLNHYQSEIDTLVNEQRDYKAKIKLLSKQHLMQNLVQSTHMSQSFTTNDSVFINTIKDLRIALRRQCNENAYLKIKLAHRDFKSHTTNSVNKCKPLWLFRAQGCQDKVDVVQERLLHLVTELSQLENDYKMSLAKASIWNFNRPVKSQMVEERLKKKIFLDRYKKLQIQVIDFIKNYSNNYQVQAHFTNFLTPELTKLMTNKLTKAATVFLPSKEKSNLETVSIEITLDHLKKFHQILL